MCECRVCLCGCLVGGVCGWREDEQVVVVVVRWVVGWWVG
jgi:hypothetical protein